MMAIQNTASPVRHESPATSYPGRHQSICNRCGGLMVSDLCIDLLNSTNELECTARRCVQCGDIIDAVILRNRSIRQQSLTIQHQSASMY
jgi:hypothetical protein